MSRVNKLHHARLRERVEASEQDMAKVRAENPQCQFCRYRVKVVPSTEKQRLRGEFASGIAECRRYPPVPGYLGGTLQSFWPQVEPDGWCGEYEEKGD